jgi:hypothetical protein
VRASSSGGESAAVGVSSSGAGAAVRADKQGVAGPALLHCGLGPRLRCPAAHHVGGRRLCQSPMPGLGIVGQLALSEAAAGQLALGEAAAGQVALSAAGQLALNEAIAACAGGRARVAGSMAACLLFVLVW